MGIKNHYHFLHFPATFEPLLRSEGWTGPDEASWPHWAPNEEKKWETDVHILFTDMVANLLEAMLDKVWSHGLPRLQGSQKDMYLIIVAFPPKIVLQECIFLHLTSLDCPTGLACRLATKEWHMR